MKSNTLKPLFTWNDRRVLIHDRIWYFPNYHEEQHFVFPGWDSPELFGNNNPIHIEYCSGNGAWIVQKAMDFPEINWVAVEIKYERVRKIWSKMKSKKLTNLVIVCGEGNRWTQNYVSPNSISKAYVNFPDPWPKNCHAKHRIISPAFASQMAKILVPGGEMIMVTDDAPYSSIMIDTFNHSTSFKSKHPQPYYVTALQDYGSSYFDELWRDKGRVIRYHQFLKEPHENRIAAN